MAGVQLRVVRAALPIAVLLAFIAGGTLIVGQRLDGGVRLNGVVQGAYSIANSGLGTTSTDGFTLQNTTPSNATTTVQISPRVKLCGTAYNSTSTLSETNCMFAEALPATVAGTTSATLKLGYINNAGTVTYPMTVDSLGQLTAIGNLFSSGDVRTAGTGSIYFNGRAVFKSPSDGNMSVANLAGAIGSQFKVDALPTVASGFGTSPSITAGSTPLAGSVNVGTGAAGAGVINFNGTAFPSAPFVVCLDDSTVLAIRCTATTTQLTMTPAATFTASDVISWIAISSK